MLTLKKHPKLNKPAFLIKYLTTKKTHQKLNKPAFLIKYLTAKKTYPVENYEIVIFVTKQSWANCKNGCKYLLLF